MASSRSRNGTPAIAVCQDDRMPLALRHSCLLEPAVALASQLLQLRTFGDQLFSICKRRLFAWSRGAH
jgi:hypothetical protein